MLDWTGAATDWIERIWMSRGGRRARSAVLVIVLLGGIALIELRRLGWLPASMDGLPTNHLNAIAWTVTVLLIQEVVEMLLALGRSVADSAGRHLQLYALVLLRDAFLLLGKLPEPISVTEGQYLTVAAMGADAAGAVLLFLTATLFARMQRHRPVVHDAADVRRFRNIKKTIALVMLGVLAALCVRDLVQLASGHASHELFDVFFTVLVFVDVLLAVISLGYTDVPAVIFRNFGFAFAAIVLRLAIASPEFVRPVLGVIGGLVAIAVTITYNLSDDASPEEDDEPPERDRPDPARPGG
jgi:glycopeptide antibiotics resistance protein